MRLHIQKPSQIQRQPRPSAVRSKIAPSSTQQSVAAVLRSPGQKLDEPTRDSFGPRFDFSRVRIHADARAAASADTLHARAYTVGHHVVFGRNEYAPESKSGRSLLAHELAHVMQQRHATASGHSRFEIGNPSHPAEKEADAFAKATFSNTSQTERFDKPPRISQISNSSGSNRLLQRSPKKDDGSLGGSFISANYAKKEPDANDPTYGADIDITFTPNNKVNADKIAFVQTAQSSIAGQPVSIYFNDDRTDDLANPDSSIEPAIRGIANRNTKTSVSTDSGKKIRDTETSRMIDITDPIAPGTKIDSVPENRTPLAGMQDPPKGKNELADSVETKNGKFGSGHPGEKPKDASMHDNPRLAVPDKQEASQTFESAVVAVAGEQQGAFYGSVRWGWKKSSTDKKVTLVKFEPEGKSVPSPVFQQAAGLWNGSKSTLGEASIPLPVAKEMFTSLGKLPLMDKADKGKSFGNLEPSTRVEVTEKVDSANKDWKNVIVVTGSLAGKVGWLRLDSLSDKPIETAEKKPAKK